MRTLQEHANRLKEIRCEIMDMAMDIGSPLLRSEVYDAAIVVESASKTLENNVNGTMDLIINNLENDNKNENN